MANCNIKLTLFDGGSRVTPAQCRAARGLVDWSQSELGERSGVGQKAIADFERGMTKRPYRRTLDAMIAAFESAGVEFITRGVRMRASRRDARMLRD
jgi:transcriptional regulator with XRE-family HTH domain